MKTAIRAPDRAILRHGGTGDSWQTWTSMGDMLPEVKHAESAWEVAVDVIMVERDDTTTLFSGSDNVVTWLALGGSVTTTMFVPGTGWCCMATEFGIVWISEVGTVIVEGIAIVVGTATVVPPTCCTVCTCIPVGRTVIDAGAIGTLLNWLGTSDSGQKRWAGNLWIFDFFALGPSGLLASSIGCRIRRRALINLQQVGGFFYFKLMWPVSGSLTYRTWQMVSSRNFTCSFVM